MDIVTIIMLVALGIITSYTDLKKSKINNKTLLLFFIMGFLYSLTNLIIDGDLNNIVIYFGNIGFAALMGYLLFILDLWAPGDGKLFTTYTAIIPLNGYLGNLTIFQPLYIFINTFLVIAAYLIFRIIFMTTWKQKTELFNNILSLKVFVRITIYFFCLHYLYQMINLGFLSFFLVLLLFFLVEKIRGGAALYLAYVIAIVRLFIDKTIWSTEWWGLFMAFVTVFYFTYMFITEGSYIIYTKTKKLSQLKSGDKVADYISYDDKFVTTKRAKITDAYLTPGQVLTSKHIKKLKELAKKCKEFKKVGLTESGSFAVQLFIGALTTVIIGKSVIFVFGIG